MHDVLAKMCMMCWQVGLLAQIFAPHVYLGENDVAQLLETRENACGERETGQAAETWDFVRCTGPASELESSEAVFTRSAKQAATE